MSAKLNGAMRTGRASRVREFLSRQTEPVSAREILDAVEPGGDINLMSATLSTMSRGRGIERIGAGHGNVRWQVSPRHSRTTPTRPMPAAHASARPQAAPAKSAPRPTTTLPAPTVVQKQPRRTREQKTNFSAPLATVSQVARSNATAGFETVDDFLRRGGRIQRLRSDECSQPLRFDHSRHGEQRAKGRATQQRIRASRN